METLVSSSTLAMGMQLASSCPMASSGEGSPMEPLITPVIVTLTLRSMYRASLGEWSDVIGVM